MRLNGKDKKVILLFCFLCCLLTSCGIGDWRYDKLPGDYEVWRINSYSIVLGRNKNGFSLDVVVGRFITEFCYNDSTIAIKKVEIDTETPYDTFDFDEVDWADPDYYIIDAENNLLYGPYTPQEFNRKLVEMGADDLGEWIKTEPAPSGATYN